MLAELLYPLQSCCWIPLHHAAMGGHTTCTCVKCAPGTDMNMKDRVSWFIECYDMNNMDTWVHLLGGLWVTQQYC